MGGWTNKLLVLPFAMWGLIGLAAPARPAVLRAVIAVVVLGVVGLGCVRALRMGVTADASGLTVHNLGRDYSFHWSELAALDCSRSDNITQSVSTITVVLLDDGRKVVARGASAYSRKAVQAWRQELVAAAPSRWPGAVN